MALMENKITLPFPVQNTLTAEIRKEAESIGNGEYLSVWAGTSFEKIRALSAIELIREIEKELDSFTEVANLQNLRVLCGSNESQSAELNKVNIIM